MQLPAIANLNLLPSGEFATALRPLFETAGPLAEALYTRRPFGSYAELIEQAELIAERLPTEEQIQVVSAHPRIGENAAVVRDQSALSYREQGYDREASLPVQEVDRVYAALAELNRAYEDRFGFRFVVFVNQRPKSEIVDVLRERLLNSRTTELETGLRELFAIARDRYRQVV